MAMKDYSDQFKADAVALYESTPGATYKSIAADLGINRATLREWVLRDRERRGAGQRNDRGDRLAHRFTVDDEALADRHDDLQPC